MNIRAKIILGKTCVDNKADTNGGLGESYTRYWSYWLPRALKRTISMLPRTASPAFNAEGARAPVLAQFTAIDAEFGNAAIFAASYRQAADLGFDPIKYLLFDAPDMRTFVRRWQRLIHAQASLRQGHAGTNQPFIAEESETSFVLTPAAVQPACAKPFGPAMLGGVVAGTLETIGQSGVDVWELRRAGASRAIMLNGRITGGDIGFDSSLLIKAGVSHGRPHQVPHCGALCDPLCDLAHLVRIDARPMLARLLAVCMAGEGCYRPLEETARLIGISVRTLSRRLSEAGISYATIIRFARLRKACIGMASDKAHFDDIAFEADYADRHHMAREFRRMAQISPSAYRDILHS